MKRNVLVIGGGTAGISAALELAKCGYYVYLLEKDTRIGGWASSFTCKANTSCTKCSVCLVKTKIREVITHPDICIFTNSILKRCSGEIGHFEVEILKGFTSGEQATERLVLPVHAIISATGFDMFDVRQYGRFGYGRYRGVLTGYDLEKLILEKGGLYLPGNAEEAPSIAFVQCTGSRNDNNNYCSRVCCKYAMRFALFLKHQNPSVSISMFFIDIQNAGKGFAPVYDQCLECIQFIRGMPVKITESQEKRLEVKYEDIARGTIKWDVFDMIVLSTGITPRPDSWDVAKILGINLDEYGFFETAGDYNTNETNVKGIYIAGSCQGPKDIPDSIAHGIAAAEKVTALAAPITRMRKRR